MNYFITTCYLFTNIVISPREKLIVALHFVPLGDCAWRMRNTGVGSKIGLSDASASVTMALDERQR